MSLLLWLHVVGGVVVTGLALFWAIMGHALARAHDRTEAERLLGIAASARWPHVALPEKLRLPLPLASAAALIATGLIGLVLPAGYGWAMLFKLLASLGLLLCFLALGRRPVPALGHAALALAVIVTVLSALIGR